MTEYELLKKMKESSVFREVPVVIKSSKSCLCALFLGRCSEQFSLHARQGIMSIWDQADLIKVSEDEIAFLTKGEDPYDDDVVLNLVHPYDKRRFVSTKGLEALRDRLKCDT